MVLGGTPDKQLFYFSKNDFWKAQNGYPNGGVCYVGQLQISSSEMKGASYQVEQKIADATINGSFAEPDGSSYQLRAWCAATQNIAVIELQAGTTPVHFDLNFMMEESMDAEVENGRKDGINWYVRKFEGTTLEWPTAVAVGMKVLDKENASGLSLAAGEKATIVLSFCTNHEQQAYIDQSVECIKSFDKKNLNSLSDAHKQWWTSFWNESQVKLGDPMLEKYYYGSHYLLACCSRNTAFPPGLWGTSLTMDATANGWAGDYHLNYNHMAPWWGVYSSNHIGLAEPYDTPILEYMEKGRAHAKEFLNKKGVYYPVGIGPKGFCSSMFPLTSEDMMKQYNTPETYFTSAARLGYDGESLLDELRKRITKTALSNLWIEQSGGGIETLSAVPSCINEMLLQGYEGVIRLFPVWPKDKDASFRNLRAHGAFLVSSSCKNNVIEYVTLISEKGRTCKIENPWGDTACIVVHADGTEEIYKSKQFEIETSPGEEIKLLQSNQQ